MYRHSPAWKHLTRVASNMYACACTGLYVCTVAAVTGAYCMWDMWAMSADNTCGMFTFHVSYTVCKVTNIECLRLSCTCICVRGLQSQSSAPLVTVWYPSRNTGLIFTPVCCCRLLSLWALNLAGCLYAITGDFMVKDCWAVNSNMHTTVFALSENLRFVAVSPGLREGEEREGLASTCACAVIM